MRLGRLGVSEKQAGEGSSGTTTIREHYLQGTRKSCQAGAPKHRQRFSSVRPGGWSRTPVHSSGTSLTLALGGGLKGPPRPVITP